MTAERPATGTAELDRYVPRVASEWHFDAPGSLWQEIDSTLCFVDLSGFTKLSERLARKGRIGAEELTEVLNRVFGRMLDLAYDRGGALLKFGGDALLLHFIGDDHSLHAACAAMEMRAALREAAEIPTSVGRVSLRMSVGIHTGVVHVFKVGTSHRELIVTGPAATAVALMETTADAGEIVISPQTAARLPAAAVGAAKGPGFLLRWRRAPVPPTGALPRRSVPLDIIAECLPVALRDHLIQGGIEPEHRVATVGFVKFQGVDQLMADHGPQGVAAALHELASNVQRAVDDARVTLLASDLDKDGGKFILTTGVPATQEDDDGRMLRAARAIVEAGSALSVRVGVNRGHVFAGEIGATHRATFTIMGDTVNLAARLMAAAAPGQLYVSPEVLDRSRTLFEAAPLDPFYVKGKAAPVQAYAVGGELGARVAARAHELPFVGRDREMALVAGAMDRTRGGQGSVITIVGGPGVGKSRLVEESRALAADLALLSIAGDPAAASSPYRAFSDAIRQLLQIERAPQATMAAALHRAVAARAPELIDVLPLLGDVTHIDAPPTATVDNIELRFRPDRTADALIRLLDAGGAAPMMILVEDAQWLDSSSVALVDRLVAATRDHPWLVMVVRRPGSAGADPAAGERIELQPLEHDDVTGIALAATSGAPLRPHEIELIAQRSGGSPLFLGELLRMARTGRVEDLPASLDAVVNAELDQLGGLARRLVRFASVLGRSFSVTLLRALLVEEQIELDDATLRGLGTFLEYEGADGLRFRHALHRDVAYEGLPYRRRRELHLRAGLITERLAGGEPDDVADVLSMHFMRAADYPRAWRYAKVAGERARLRYANVEAAAQYEMAIEAGRRLRSEPDEVADMWRVLGDVRESLAMFEDAIDAYRRAAELVRHDPVARADLLWRRARVRMHLGAYRTALAEASRGHRLLPAGDVSAAPVRARLTSLQALLRQAQQRAEPARRLAARAIDEATAAGDDAALARAFLITDWANRVLGAKDAEFLGELALSLYRRVGDLDGVAKASNNLGGIAYFAGNWDDAVKWYRAALDAYRSCGNDANAAVVGSNLAEVLVSQRAFAEAEPMLLNSIRVMRSSRALDDVLFAEIQLGRLRVERGDGAAAVEHLLEVRGEATAVGQVGYAFEAAMYLASAMVSLGRFHEAIETLDAATAEVGLVDPLYRPALMRVRALALAGAGDFAAGRAALAEGLASAREQELAYDEGLLLLAGVQLDRAVGREPVAADVERLSAIFSQLHVAYELPDDPATGTEDRPDRTPAMS